MKGFRAAVTLLIFTAASPNAGYAAPGPGPKSGTSSSVSGKMGTPGASAGSTARKAGQAARGPALKNGGLPGTSGKPGSPGPGGGSSSINGTGMGALH